MLLVPVERENGTVRIQTVTPGESLTEQSHRSTTNINAIVAKARRGIPVHSDREPYFGDFSSGMDYREAMEKIRDCKRDFLSYPPEIRKRFENDPAQFLDFVLNPDNAKELKEMGLTAENTPAIPEPVPDPEPDPEPAQPPTT